ncbi:anaphase-promoting complex subunit 7 [Thraustotheca clavata]|uniref:Anaphase-promoting complex subunit 7 n=1 Tax=Thraustotheca clavata TaxID=74557 RepID=A0A1V9Z9Z2_9STRA|nr:anaphase-promoting complex subunit 7 [Thraustotheca clavata]
MSILSSGIVLCGLYIVFATIIVLTTLNILQLTALLQANGSFNGSNLTAIDTTLSLSDLLYTRCKTVSQAFSLILNFDQPLFQSNNQTIHVQLINNLNGWNKATVLFYINGYDIAITCMVRHGSYYVEGQDISTKRAYDPMWICKNSIREREMLVRTLELQMSNLLHDGEFDSVLLLGSLVASLNKPQEQFGAIYELYADALMAKRDTTHALRYYKLCLALECGNEVTIRLKIARCMHQLDDISNALVILKALPANTRPLPVLMLLGKLYQSQGLTQQAKLAYSAALNSKTLNITRLNPYALEASFALAEMALNEQKQIDIQLPSTDGEWLNALFTTRECILTHRLPNALEAIERVEKIFSTNLYTLLEKARVQMELEWTELSLNSFHKARQLDNANVMYMDMYAKLLKQCGLTTQLNNLVRDLLGISDNRPEPWLAAACYSDMKGDSTTALQLCDRAIALDKDFARSHVYRGQLLFKLNRAEHAVAAFTTACKLEKSLDGYEGLVESYCDICLKGVDKYLDAMNVARLALLQAPKSPRSHVLLGTVLSLRPENRDKAKKTFERALTLNPDTMRAHFGLVDLWIHDGKYDQAIAKLLTLAQKQPRDVLYVKLGDVYTLNREYGNALPYYHRALSINPTLTKALQGLERVEKLMRGEDPDAALSTINGTIDDDDIESEYVDGV